MLLKRSLMIAAGIQLPAWSTALAHPGHGATEADQVQHYLIEPVHCWWIVLVLAISGAGFLVHKSFQAKQKQVASAQSRRQY